VSHCHVAPLFSVDAFISSQHLVRLCEVPIHTSTTGTIMMLTILL
jgi:hypothetical protein